MTDDLALWRSAAYRHARERDEARDTLADLRATLQRWLQAAREDQQDQTGGAPIYADAYESVLQLLNQAGVPSPVAQDIEESEAEFDAAMAAGEPVELVDLPELTREDALDLVDDLGQQAYQAEDRLAFIAEMCDAADRAGEPVTTERVRSWLQYNGCGGVLRLPDDVMRALRQYIEAGSYAEKVNAPLRPETIAAINERIKSGEMPVRKIRMHDHMAGDFLRSPKTGETPTLSREFDGSIELPDDAGVAGPATQAGES